MHYYDLKGFEGIYQISKLGRIRNSEKVNMKFFKSKDGYLRVTLFNDGKQSNHYIHLLMAKQFLTKSQGHVQVDHISRVRTDNRLVNLRWVTLQEQNDNRILNN